jgi:hypothetical protein
MNTNLGYKHDTDAIQTAAAGTRLKFVTVTWGHRANYITILIAKQKPW